MTLDEFRELTKDIPGETQLLVYDSTEAERLLDSGELGTFLLESVQQTTYVSTDEDSLISALLLGA